MNRHTPGPWDWHGPYMTKGYKVSALTAAGRQTLKVFVDHCEGRNTEADARLIASAPDLLAALAQISYLTGGHDTANDLVALARIAGIARSALAKAEGVQS